MDSGRRRRETKGSKLEAIRSLRYNKWYKEVKDRGISGYLKKR